MSKHTLENLLQNPRLKRQKMNHKNYATDQKNPKNGAQNPKNGVKFLLLKYVQNSLKFNQNFPWNCGKKCPKISCDVFKISLKLCENITKISTMS